MIPYHITVTTGTEYDSSTDSRVYIIIMGPQKVQTERLWLDLPEEKDEFADGSVEKFSVWGRDVGEIKKVEVLSECNTSTRASCEICGERKNTFLLRLTVKALGSKKNVDRDVLMRFHMCLNLKISSMPYISQNQGRIIKRFYHVSILPHLCHHFSLVQPS